MPIVDAHSLSGECYVRSSHPIFATRDCIGMVIDILAERGFQVVCDVRKSRVADTVDLKMGTINYATDRFVIFFIKFRRPVIRKEEDD